MDIKIKCDMHHLPALYFDSHKDSQKKLLCTKCIAQKLQLQSIEEFRDSQYNKFNKINQQSDQSIKLLQDFIEVINSYKQQVLQSIEKLLQTSSEIIKKLVEKKTCCEQLFDCLSENTINVITEHQENLVNIIFGIKNQLNNDLIDLSTISKTDAIFKIFRSFDPKMDIEESEMNKVKLEQLDKSYSDNVSTQSSFIIDKKFNYQLIQQSSYKEYQYCFAITFNKDNTLMIAGSSNMIKVFEFKDDKLKVIQQLNGHTQSVVCFQFMKKSNKFISACYDIIFWEQIQNNQWQSIQVLKAHAQFTRSLIMNLNEDMLISGSDDKTIKFWRRENNTWNSKQSIQCSHYVYSVSLSNNEDKLIASIYDKQILVIQLQGIEWIINQKISVEQYGHRLGFISQDQFIFQPIDGQQLLIYDYNEKEQQYKQGAEVKYQNKGSDGASLFPIQYIQQMGLILVKNDEYVHLIKRVQNGQYTVEQSIHFGTNSVFGCISDDGRYIATWDQNSKEIQIRKNSD